MNTAYTTPIPLFSGGAGFRAGVDLQQLFASPTVAFKANAHNAFGIALNVAFQKFAAQGLEGFASASEFPNNLTERGFSNSFGVGFRAGWLGTVNQRLSLGLTFQSRTYMQAFNKYKGLFAQQGSFDIPANVAGGVALKVFPKATVLFDAERIFYGQVNSISDPDFPIPPPLGASSGPGFGWHDITAEKVGFDYKLNSTWTLRAGYNHSGLPFDILAPAVVQNHISAGATWSFGSGKEISLAYQHAFENTVNGVNSIPTAFGGGEANVRMYQDLLALSFGWGK
jgi:long-chain fatty acid transport protein